MSAIKHFSLRLQFYTKFHNFHRLFLVLKGIKRNSKKFRKPKRAPVTPALLKVIKYNLFNSSRCFEDKVMLWAALLVAFFGILRVSEYTASHKTKFDPETTLLFSDLDLHGSRALIFIKASKTDPFRQGVHIRIAANGSMLCPINALGHMVAMHPSRNGPLFMFKNGRFLTRKDINSLLVDASDGMVNLSSHSLRIGAASTAADMGCPKWLIQHMGRWTSDCFRDYIRVPDNMIDKTSRALARCSNEAVEAFQPHFAPLE